MQCTCFLILSISGVALIYEMPLHMNVVLQTLYTALAIGY